MNLLKTRAALALSVLLLNTLIAKNFDPSQSRLVDTLEGIRPGNVFFNPVNGQTLGYLAIIQVQEVLLFLPHL